MKKLLMLGFVMFSSQACSAIGELQDAAAALDQAKKDIHELHVADCMSECSSDAHDCFDQANGACIDACEDDFNACQDQEDTCHDMANKMCANLDGSDYYNCVHGYDEQCDYNCDINMSDCGQACGDQLSECFFDEQSNMDNNPAYSQCVSDCVKDMEDTLKGIDL